MQSKNKNNAFKAKLNWLNKKTKKNEKAQTRLIE